MNKFAQSRAVRYNRVWLNKHKIQRLLWNALATMFFQKMLMLLHTAKICWFFLCEGAAPSHSYFVIFLALEYMYWPTDT